MTFIVLSLLAGTVCGILVPGRFLIVVVAIAAAAAFAHFSSLEGPEEQGYGLFMGLPMFLALFGAGIGLGAILRSFARRG
jgi:hypothetical protein